MSLSPHVSPTDQQSRSSREGNATANSEKLRNWLEQNEMKNLFSVLSRNDLDLDHLASVNGDTLRSLGLTSSTQKKLFNALGRDSKKIHPTSTIQSLTSSSGRSSAPRSVFKIFSYPHTSTPLPAPPGVSTITRHDSIYNAIERTTCHICQGKKNYQARPQPIRFIKYVDGNEVFDGETKVAAKWFAEERKEDKCYACSGVGTIPMEHVPCSACKSTGITWLVAYHSRSLGETMIEWCCLFSCLWIPFSLMTCELLLPRGAGLEKMTSFSFRFCADCHGRGWKRPEKEIPRPPA